MTEVSDQVVFSLVVAARFLVPLLIPRYPLPAILAALVIDGIDQTIFQQFTNLPLEGYQGYDKALDIYYLTIAYISTLRNWSNQFAFQVSRFLFYWRLVGVALFEITHLRPLLLIFPNTFEYFFIFYEAYRLRWDPRGMGRRLVIGAAAGIWIVIKLPQEWWIHIAQLDTTDLIKEQVFGVPVDTPWGEIIGAYSGVFVAAIVLIALVVIVVYGLAKRYLPPADRKLAFAADAYQPEFSAELSRGARAMEARTILDWALLEKVVMVSLVSVIFAQVLPDVSATNLQLAIGVALVVIINTALSHLLARRRIGWASILRQFIAMAVVNFSLVLAYAGLLRRIGGSLDLATTLFFALLLTLLVVLFDRYRQVYLMRFALSGSVRA
jgi:hypothetical protein